MFKRHNTDDWRPPGRLLFQLSGLAPGRALRAVLNEGYKEGGGRSDGCIRTVEGRKREMIRWWCSRAQAEGRASAAGAVRLLFNIRDSRACISRQLSHMARMLSTMEGMLVGRHFVMRDGRAGRHLHLVMDRRARHAKIARDRMER